MLDQLSLLSFASGGWGSALLAGSLVTIALALSCLPIGLPLGLLVAVAARSKNRWMRAWATTFSTVFRGLPELLTLLIIYYGCQIAAQKILGLMGYDTGIMKERATFITDLWDLTSFFFVAPAEYEEKQTRKYWKGQNPEILRELRSVLAAIDDFSLENTERIVHGWIEQKGYGMGQVMNTLRLALVGAGKGPGMYDVTSFIGKEETLRRIDHILATLKPAE